MVMRSSCRFPDSAPPGIREGPMEFNGGGDPGGGYPRASPSVPPPVWPARVRAFVSPPAVPDYRTT